MIVGLTTYYIILGFFVFIFGVSIGSFLNVVAYRVPLNISICTPRSFCPACRKKISLTALIPVLGYLFKKGRCEYCAHKISLQYPFIEIITGLLTVFLFFRFSDYGFFFSAPLIATLWLLYSGIALSLIDIKYRILPDVIVLPGIIIGFIISCFDPSVGWAASLGGILLGSGGLFLISKLYEIIRKQEGMGMGDVKYLGFLGAVTGFKEVVFTLIIASIIGSVYGIILGIFNKKGLKTELPFGPFLALSALIIRVYG